MRFEKMGPNNYRIEGNIAYIELTQGEEALIDVEDLEKILQYRWCTVFDKNDNYYAGCYSYPQNGKRQFLRMHRFVMNAPQGIPVDHIHFNTLDNRKSQLRLSTSQKNSCNRKSSHVESRMGMRGISETRTDGKQYYRFQCKCKRCIDQKLFIYNSAGLMCAIMHAKEHYAKMLATL